MAKKNPRIVMIRLDNWEGLYVDGELKDQDHKIHLEDFCKYVGLKNFDSKWIDSEEGYNWLESVGNSLPDNLDEIPTEILS